MSSPQKRVILGVSVNLLIILALVWISLARLKNDQKLASYESERILLQNSLKDVFSNLAKMQNSAKGYARFEMRKSSNGKNVDGNAKFTTKFQRSVFDSERILVELDSKLANDAFSKARLHELNLLVHQKIQFYNQLIEYAKYEEFEKVKIFFLGEDLEITDKIDENISSIQTRADKALLDQIAEQKSLEKKLKLAFIILIILALALPVAGLIVTTYYLKGRLAATLLLEGNKQLLQSILDNTSNPIFIKEISGNYLFVNKQFASTFNLTNNEIPGKTDFDLFSKDIADKIRSNDLEAISANKELKFEELYPNDGSYRTYSVMKFPISNVDGKVYAVGGIASDITEQKQTQFELIESESLLNATINVAPQAIIMVNKESRILRWNLKAEELFNWAESDVIGKLIYDIIMPPSSGESQIKELKTFIEKSQGPNSHKTLELFTIKKNRVIFQSEVIISSIVVKEKPLFLLFLRDISLTKHLENENLRTRNFLNSVIENIPDMVFVKDAKDLRFISINKAGEKLLGYNSNELIGKSDYNFFTKEQAEFFTNKDKMVLEKGALVDIPEEEIDTKTGKKWLHTKKITIRDEKGKPLYLLGISEDITEKRRLEKEKKEIEEKMHENEQKLELILENIGEGVFVADTNQKAVLFNHTAEEILEFKGEAISSDWSNSFNLYYSDGKTIFPSQELPTEKALKGISTDELELILEDPESKNRKLIKVSGQPIRDEKGNIIAAVTTIKDITKYKEMEKALEESEQKYRKLIGFGRS